MKTILFLLFALVPGFAFAQIDITGATTAISDGQVAVLAVLGALIAAYAAFLGYRMVKTVMRRGG